MELRKNGLGPNAPPVQGKWMHGALLKFHENYSGGKRLKFLGDAEIKVSQYVIQLKSILCC